MENTVSFFNDIGYLPKNGIANLDKMVTKVVQLLLSEKKSIATAESCTGGMVSQLITSVPDSSKIFELGICSYSDRIKAEVLGVPAEVLEKYGAVSSQTALCMAKGVKLKANSDFAVSVTGTAGPGGGTPQKPIGTVYTAFCYEDKEYTQLLKLSALKNLSRENIRLNSALCIFEILEALIAGDI